MRKTHFKIHKIEGSPEEVKISGLFNHNGRLWVIHEISGTIIYRCSDYLTGIGIGESDCYTFAGCKVLAKLTLDLAKGFDFSKLPQINEL